MQMLTARAGNKDGTSLPEYFTNPVTVGPRQKINYLLYRFVQLFAPAAKITFLHIAGGKNPRALPFLIIDMQCK